MNEIELIKNRSELTENKAQEIERLFAPMVERLYEIEEQYNGIVNESEITETVSGKAKLLRLQIVKMRTKADSARKGAKAEYLRAGNAIQGAYNVFKYAVESKEEKLKAIEEHAERIEAEKIEKIRAERAQQIETYTEFEPADLGTMPADVWGNFYIGTKTAHENKIAAEKKAEAERIEKEAAEAADRERIRKENEKLKKEAAEREAKAEKERKEAAKKLKAEQEKAAKIAAEKEAKEQAERKRLADIEAKKQAEIQAKLDTERKEKAKIEAELKAKAEKEAAEKAEAERIMKAKAAAPDKDKLLQISLDLQNFVLPELNTPEAILIIKNIRGLLDKTAKYATEQAAKL